MVVFAFILTLILWLVFRPAKPQKKSKRPVKKIAQPKHTAKSVSKYFSQEQRQEIGIAIMKQDPEVVSKVIKQWLREK